MNLEKKPWKPQHVLSAEKLVGESGQSAQDFLASTRRRAQRNDFPGPDCLLPHEISLYCQNGSLAEERLRHFDECVFCRALGASLVPDPESVQEFRRQVLVERAQVEAAAGEPEGPPPPLRAARWPAYLAGAVALCGLFSIDPHLFVHPANAPTTAQTVQTNQPVQTAQTEPPPLANVMAFPVGVHAAAQDTVVRQDTSAPLTHADPPIVRGAKVEVKTHVKVSGPAPNRAHIESVVAGTLAAEWSYNQRVENYVLTLQHLANGSKTDSLTEQAWIIHWKHDPAESIGCSQFNRDGLKAVPGSHDRCRVQYGKARAEFNPSTELMRTGYYASKILEHPKWGRFDPLNAQVLASAPSTISYPAPSAAATAAFTRLEPATASSSTLYDLHPASGNAQDMVGPAIAPPPSAMKPQ